MSFFLEGIFLPIFEEKKLSNIEQNCLCHFSYLQFSPKSAFFGGFGKKVSDRDWNQRHIVYVTQVHYYTWF